MDNKNMLNPASNAVIFNILIKLSGIAKISFIMGSSFAFFCAATIFMPLAGAFAGISGCLAVFGVRAIISFLWRGVLPLHFLAYHIPGLFASFYWATESKLIRSAPAIICMILFIMHPAGNGAALYSLFWLIPIVVCLGNYNSLFATALASTFTAHAVGSVIWLYTMPTQSDMWLMLIPVVIVERLLIAVGMVVAYKALNWLFVQIPVMYKVFSMKTVK